MDKPTKISVKEYDWGKLRVIEVGINYSIPLHDFNRGGLAERHWECIRESIVTGEKRYLKIETGSELRVHPQRDGFILRDDYGLSGIDVFVSAEQYDQLKDENSKTFKELIGEE
jgi:hypothetical protein